MSKIFAVRLSADDNFEVLIAPAREAEGATPYGVGEDMIEKSTSTLSAALDMIRAVGRCASERLSELDVESTEASVGIKLTGNGNFVLAQASAEATLSVKFLLRKREQA